MVGMELGCELGVVVFGVLVGSPSIGGTVFGAVVFAQLVSQGTRTEKTTVLN